MNYDRFFKLIDRAHVVAWCAVGAFTGIITGAVLVLILRDTAKIRALYTLAGFTIVFVGLILLYFWLLRQIAAMDYNRGRRRTTALTRRHVEFKPPAILAPKKDPR